MFMQIRKAVVVTGVVAALLVASSCKRAATTNAAASTAEAKPVQVSTAKVEVRRVPVYIQSSGSFVADESSDVAPPAAGRVASTPVNVGAFVQEGQVIATLDDADPKLRLQQALAAQAQAEAALRQSQSRIGAGQDANFDVNTVPEAQAAYAAYQSAQAQAKLAQADAKRYENLVATGDVSRSNYEKQRTAAETAEAQAASARKQYEAALNAARQNWQGVSGAEASLSGAHAQVAIARKAIEDTIIRAPMSGYVSDRPVAVGEYVATTSKIATILRATPIKLFLQLSEAEAARLNSGMMVAARVAAYGDKDFMGRVSVIRPAIDPSSRSMTVEADFPNTGFTLRPGMFATARILLPEGQEGIFVPASAVLTDATTSSAQVFLIDGGKARARVVRIGDTDKDSVRIVSGLSPSAIVATNNLKDLYDGAAVQN